MPPRKICNPSDCMTVMNTPTETTAVLSLVRRIQATRSMKINNFIINNNLLANSLLRVKLALHKKSHFDIYQNEII